MKIDKKIISAIVAAALSSQCVVFSPLMASAAVTVPQVIKETLAQEDETEIISDDASSADMTNINLGGAYTGAYQIIFDMTLSGALKTGTPDRGAADDTYLTIKGGKVGPYIISTNYTEATNTQTFSWQGVNTEASFQMQIGEKYHFVISVENGSTNGGKATLEITDESGKVTFSQSGLSLRNYGDGNASDGISTLGVVNLNTEPKANITIADVIVKSSTPDSIDVTLTQPVIGDTQGSVTTHSLTKDENVIEIDPYEDSEISYAAQPYLNGKVTTAFETPLKMELNSDEAGFVIDKTNSKILISSDLPEGEYDMVLTSQVTGYDDTIIECPVTLVKKSVTTEDIIKAFESRLNIDSAVDYITWKPSGAVADSGELQFAYNNIFEDISLPTKWSDYDVTWESSLPEVISTEGKVIPKAEDTQVTLTAKINVGGVEGTKKFDLTVKGAKAGAQAALNMIVMLNSKLVKIDKTNVKEDFTISAPQYNKTFKETATAGYRGDYIKFTYEDEKDIISVDENGNATIYPSAEGNDDVVLNITATYVKDGVEVTSITVPHNLKVTVGANENVDAVLNGDVVLNADTGKAADLNNVSYDITLPSEINGIMFENWEIDNELFTISKDGKTATILGNKIGSEKGTISADVIYKKGDVVIAERKFEKEITGVLSTDMADKYIVRCDAAASKNFKDCPEDGDKINSAKDICDGNGLPTEGIFGSEIEWTSSVPKAISNTGKTVKKQSTKKTVNLTATISSGKESATYTIKNLVVPASSSSGGSSGGSSSGSSLNTPVSSTGNRAPAVSYKGTLTPNSSLEQGDITTATVSSFSDLADAAWAREAVTSLYNKGIINGKTASSFAPNDDITRAEFAKIVVKAFGLEDANATVSQFSDVATSDWYYTAVASAYSKGIIKGYENGTFGVNDKITRQDMAVIIYRAAQAAGKSIAAVKNGTVFDDAADIAAYASEAVSVLNKGGIINGMTATTFAPTATATRAQAAQMIYGIVK